MEFLKTMKELEPYLVEFEMDGTMKAKNYPLNCEVGGDNCQPIIIITHNEYKFSSNDSIRKAWTWVGDIFLQPKDCGQGIIVSEFFLLFGRLNLSFLSENQKKEVMEKAKITISKVVILFEYR